MGASSPCAPRRDGRLARTQSCERFQALVHDTEQLLFGHRLCKQVALTQLATHALQLVRFMVVFNALGNGPQPETACELDDRLARSEEHTSELQSHVNLVCRLLLE